MMMMMDTALIWIIFSFILGSTLSVNVHFENKDGGFFLKQQPRQHYASASGNTLALPDTLSSAVGGATTAANSGAPLSIDRFTVLQSSQPISVRATYGPFSTKQTVPARYVVPDPVPVNATGPVIDLQDQATHHLDMSAHIVRTEIPRDSPVLRVLFHTGTDPGSRRQILLARHQQRVCIVLHASLEQHAPLHTACSPDGEDGVCLAQITVPSAWWPPMPTPEKDGKPVKSPPRLVQVAYSVLEPWPDEGEGCHPKMQVQPSVVLGTVPLTPAKSAYKELKLSEAITMLVPHPPLFPMSRMHASVFVDREKAKALTAIVIRARVKNGMRFLDVTSALDSQWNITKEINLRHTGVTITLVRKEPFETEMGLSSNGEINELFTCLLEVAEEEIIDAARIVWNARFEPHPDDSEVETHREEGRKSITKFDIQKDDIQAVVPISKNWEILNTAVLTGQQVSQAMKVFVVSQAGKAADVTFQASCHSEDDNVIKVSSSCGSVYVDGSEQRGSINGSVLVKYGTYTGLAKFVVWMPEFPLELAVADTKLSQIKSWRIPDYHPAGKNKRRRRRRSFSPWNSNVDDLNVLVEKPTCRLRYQQTSVDVYARFMATDHESGRVNYLINRRTWLRVTDSVLPWLRVSDPRIASLHGRILQGRNVGRAEVQVLSPITSRVYGSREIRVVNDKVGLKGMQVRVVSGLQLNISPDGGIENGYVAETTVSRRLTAQYQEGLLDIELEFTDNTKTALRDISDTDYHLVVESMNPAVVAFAPMVASHHPRVIAVGEGSGDLLQVTLLLSEECRFSGRPKMKSAGPLATAAAQINVDFGSTDLASRPDILQNDGGSFSSLKGARDINGLEDILLKGGSNKDEEPNVSARQIISGNKGVLRTNLRKQRLTTLEISMYVLLAAFCCAIVVFVFSCVVYASKFRPMDNAALTTRLYASPVNPTEMVVHREPKVYRESTQNAHDWVWLGRATMDFSNKNATTVTNNNGQDVHIITNPLNVKYIQPEDLVATNNANNDREGAMPDERPLVPGASSSGSDTNDRSVDSSTYVRPKPLQYAGAVDDESGKMKMKVKNGGGRIGWKDLEKRDSPPPPPPHATPIASKKIPSNANDADEEEAKPPVPPHRNLPVGGAGASPIRPPVSPPRNKCLADQRNGNDNNRSSKMSEPFDLTDLISQMENTPQRDFMFDDESEGARKETRTKLEFVQYPRSPNSKYAQKHVEVRQATIVGNPMYSALNGTDSTEQRSGEAPHHHAEPQLPSLDDLQLGMDYEQIMRYFKNLKESNA